MHLDQRVEIKVIFRIRAFSGLLTSFIIFFLDNRSSRQRVKIHRKGPGLPILNQQAKKMNDLNVKFQKH